MRLITHHYFLITFKSCMFIFIPYSNISNSYSLVRRISISHHNGWYRLRLHVFYSRHGHAKNPDKNFSLGFRPKQSLQACLGEKLQGRKKGIPFYTFRINKHFSVKYDQVSGTDVIFLRQGIQLIPVKRVYPPYSWRDILTNLFSWMTYERRDQSCMSCKQQKADYGERVRLFFCYL